ncbi:hypothetical protein Hanom_Chr06g00509411 [Helianthus anomalus]
MNRLIQKAEKKQHNNLLKLLEEFVGESAALNGVVTWSLPIISLTCITVVILDIRQERVDNLFKSVGEGLLYTYLVEKTLNREAVYVNIRRTTAILWHEVEENCKWLETTLERSAYEEKTQKIQKMLLDWEVLSAEKILNEFNKSTNGEVEKENLHRKVIAANSMYFITKTILNTYESNDLDIVEDELLSGMIADILVACLTNITCGVAMRCHRKCNRKTRG